MNVRYHTRIAALRRAVVWMRRQRDAVVLGAADVVLWLGDLNYRIQGTYALIKAVIDKNLLEVGGAFDQVAGRRSAAARGGRL